MSPHPLPSARALAPGESLVRKQRVSELRAVAHPDLAVDMPEVELDRLRAQEQRVRDALVRLTFGHHRRDLSFLRRQLGTARPRPALRPPTTGAQLSYRLLRPRQRTERYEPPVRIVQMPARLDAPPVTSQPLTPAQLRARSLE